MFLGLDLGTSSIKAIVMADDGQIISQCTQSYPVSEPHPLWSEQDPEDWWEGCVSVINQLSKNVSLESIKAIGIAGQMHGAVLLDHAGSVLRPAILWNDGRSENQCRELEQSCPDFHTLSGNLAMPGFTSPKMLWVQQNEPLIFQAIDKVLLPKDYLTYRLTGQFSSDCSDAAGTLWLNPETRKWQIELLHAVDLNESHMPKVFEGCYIVGSLTDDASNVLKLPRVHVVAGGGDNAAGAVSMGVTEPDQGLLSIGTSGVYFVVRENHQPNIKETIHAFCHCLPNRWHQMAVSLSAASCLSWFSKITEVDEAHLIQSLEHSDTRETGVVFMPYLTGERTPHNDPYATAGFVGITNSTSRHDLVLAILESVAFSFLDGQNALESDGASVNTLTIIGGGARSSLWRQIIANVLNRTIHYREGGEVGPALGAARLAKIGWSLALDNQHGVGQKLDTTAVNLEGLIQSVCTQPKLIAKHTPDTKSQTYYANKYLKFRAFYQDTSHLNVEQIQEGEIA